VTNASENAPDVRITREIVSDVTNTSENAPDVLKNKNVPDLLSINVTVHDGLNTN
jgi:preprotein translocase subunit SecB